MKERRPLVNPVRSEAQVFRAVVIVGLVVAALVLITVVLGSTVGAVLFFGALAAGLWQLWRRSRGGEVAPPGAISGAAGVHRILVIADETAGGRALLDEISARAAGRRAEVLIVAPALAAPQPERGGPGAGEAETAVTERLRASVAAVRALGVRARGEAGDPDPNVALENGLRAFAADEVIISTHPRERSRWLDLGVVEKARRRVPVPVTHVVVDLEAESAPAG